MIEPKASGELYERHGREPSQGEQDWFLAEQAEQILTCDVIGISHAALVAYEEAQWEIPWIA